MRTSLRRRVGRVVRETCGLRRMARGEREVVAWRGGWRWAGEERGLGERRICLAVEGTSADLPVEVNTWIVFNALIFDLAWAVDVAGYSFLWLETY